jgi:hypothetical protein
MAGALQIIADLARLTLDDPRKGVRAVLQLGIPVPARTAGLLLIAVASAILTHVGFLFLPAGPDPLSQFIAASPFRTAAVQWTMLAVSVLLIFRVGRMQGGRGNLNDALLIVVWLQVLMLALQVVQLLAIAIFPPVASIIGIASVVLFLWLLTNFIAELHGFSSFWAVLGAIIVTCFAVAFVVVVVISTILGPEALSRV